MNIPQRLAGRERDQLLTDAVHLKARLVLTSKVSGSWQTHKSRLLDVAPARRALVVSYPIDEGRGPADFTRGEQVGVSFRHHNCKCLFGATIVGKRQPRRHGTRAFGSKALLLSWPEQIEQLQRRVYYRVSVPGDCPIPVRLWKGGATLADQRPASAGDVVIGRILDLSVGGMRVEIARAHDPRFEENDVVCAEFSPAQDQRSILLDACFRHVESAGDDRLALGFQFIGIEASDSGPALLSRLARAVTRLQSVKRPGQS